MDVSYLKNDPREYNPPYMQSGSDNLQTSQILICQTKALQ